LRALLGFLCAIVFVLGLLPTSALRAQDVLRIDISRVYTDANCISGELRLGGDPIATTLEVPLLKNVTDQRPMSVGTYTGRLRYDGKDHWTLLTPNSAGQMVDSGLHFGERHADDATCVLLGQAVDDEKCSLRNTERVYEEFRRTLYGTESPTATPERSIAVTIR
jgi:Family of unknown function (DUF5675)